MGDIRPANVHTRRAALTLATTALPAMSQPKSTGHPVVHFEIGCRDRARTERFFSDLFGWHFQQGMAGTIDTGSERGVPGHVTSLGHEPHHYTMFYVEVEDVKEYLDKAVALGGKVVVPPVKIPTGTFAWFSDLEGNTIGLVKSDRK